VQLTEAAQQPEQVGVSELGVVMTGIRRFGGFEKLHWHTRIA
jgi:hypothetical protein